LRLERPKAKPKSTHTINKKGGEEKRREKKVKVI
jgi:hypothetical protein